MNNPGPLLRLEQYAVAADRIASADKGTSRILIELARGIRMSGGTNMDFSAFDTRQMEEYATQAKASWGATDAYHEYEEKSKNRTADDEYNLGERLMQIFSELGKVKSRGTDSEDAQTIVRQL